MGFTPNSEDVLIATEAMGYKALVLALQIVFSCLGEHSEKPK